MSGLSNLWVDSASIPPPEAEQRFKEAFSHLINSSSLSVKPDFKNCPAASNSIELVAAYLSHQNLSVSLLEPTFANLALMLRRRNAAIKRIAEDAIRDVEDIHQFRALLKHQKTGALFLINPNNPTGWIIDERSFRIIATACAAEGKLLVVVNSFRLCNRQPYDDYLILDEAGVSYIAFEDTGKVWPAHDTKASLLAYAKDNKKLMGELYSEIYLCSSKFDLNLFANLFTKTKLDGMDASLWKYVDEHRRLLRARLSSTT